MGYRSWFKAEKRKDAASFVYRSPSELDRGVKAHVEVIRQLPHVLSASSCAGHFTTYRQEAKRNKKRGYALGIPEGYAAFNVGHILLHAEDSARGRAFIKRLGAFVERLGGFFDSDSEFEADEEYYRAPAGTSGAIYFVDPGDDEHEYQQDAGVPMYFAYPEARARQLHRRQSLIRRRVLDFLREEAVSAGRRFGAPGKGA